MADQRIISRADSRSPCKYCVSAESQVEFLRGSGPHPFGRGGAGLGADRAEFGIDAPIRMDVSHPDSLNGERLLREGSPSIPQIQR